MFITVVCTILVSVLFCACGNKYKNLEIKYTGKEDMIVLVMDTEYQNEYNNLGATGETQQVNKRVKEIHFEVSGIKAKLMGEIKVQVIPQDLAQLGEVAINGTDIGFYIRALKSGNGSLVVTHLSSGKSTSVMLHVDKKAVSSSANGNMLVVDIPDEQHLTEEGKFGLTEQEIAEKEELLNQKIFTIDADTLLNFNPVDATDIVDWQLVDATGANTTMGIGGVEFGNFTTSDDEDEEKINNQIKVSADSAGGIFYLKPILKMNGYEDLVQNFVVRVNVVKVLDKDNIEILSQDAIASNSEKLAETDTRFVGAKLVNDGVKLFANSTDYSSASFAIFNGQESLLDSKLYNADLLDDNSNNGLYKISIATSCSQIGVEDDSIALGGQEKQLSLKTLIGLNYSANKEWVSFNFVPQNAVGDIQPFVLKLNVYLTEIATRIDMKMDNEKVDTTVVNDKTNSANIVLLDYYAKYNNNGQLFTFEVIKSSCDNSLKQMRLRVDKSILSSNNGGDENSSVLYFLEFRKGAQFLQFETVENENYMISSPFKNTDRLYIKYIFNTQEGATEDKDLSFDVVNFYDGSYNEVLEDGTLSKENALKGTEKTLTVSVSRGRGVKSLELKASNVKSQREAIEYKLTDNTFYIINSNIEKQTDILTETGSSYNLKTDKFVFGFSIGNILGASNRVLSNAEKMNIEFEFDVKDENGNVVDCFDYYQYKQSQNNFSKLYTKQFHLDIKGKTIFNSINLIKNDNATILDGRYTFTLYQKSSGYEISLTFYVVSNLSLKDLNLAPFDESLNLAGLYYNAYVKLETEPTDWTTNYSNYFVYDSESKKYVKVAGETAPTFETDKYWTTTYAGYMGNTYIIPTDYKIATNLRAGEFTGANFVENSLLYRYIKSIKAEISVVDAQRQATTFGATSYLNYSPSTILNTCRTGEIKTSLFGTFINGDRHYVHIVFKVSRDEYEMDENGFYLLKTSPTVLEKPIDIFVYVPVDRAYINDNVSTTSVLVDDNNLGYYFKDLSRKSFQLNIPNPYNTSQNMFDYLDFEWRELESLSANEVSYSADKITQNVHFINNNNAVIMAKITQFNQQRNVVCQVVVRSAQNTQDIAIRNNLMTINNSKYVSVKLGKTFKFDVDIVGNGSFDELKYVVCDNAGNVLKNYIVSSNGQILNVKDKDGNATSDSTKLNFAQDFKVIIFAKDWLYKDVDSEFNVFNFNDLTEYLIHDKFANKVKIVDIKIRDGSEYFPFLISNASEMREISSYAGEFYYQLVSDINMSNVATNLGNFNGHLNSFVEFALLTSQPDDWTTNFGNYYLFNAGKYEKLTSSTSFAYRKFYRAVQSHFTIYNIKLGNKSTNNSYNISAKENVLPTNVNYLALFDVVNKNASIENITFQVNFNELTINSNIQLVGVIGENFGEIRNVAVELGGKIFVNNNVAGNELYIGGLVGKNGGQVEGETSYGKIVETNPNFVYSSGYLTVERRTADKGTKIYLGGLVGINLGKIVGVLPTTESGIEYVLMYEEQGSLFNGELALVNSLKSELKNGVYYINSAVGGVVGVNINLTNTSDANKKDNKINDTNFNTFNIIKNMDLTNINGTIVNAYSSGKVSGDYVVGGMIGFNWGNGDNVGNWVDTDGNVSTDVSIVDSLSTTKIDGDSYVGGFVGFDYKGVMNHAYYEVYNTYTAPQGDTSVLGKRYVGGLIGYGFMSKVAYTYFHSFRWTYITQRGSEDIKFADSEFYYGDKDGNKKLKNPDILGEQYIGGLIGYAMNNGEDAKNKVVINNSAVDAYIKANKVTDSTDNAIAGLVGYSNGKLNVDNAYVQGYVEYTKGNSNGYKDVRVFEGGNEITDSLTFAIYHKLYSKNTDQNYTLLKSGLPADFVPDNDINNGWYYIKFKGKNLITEAPTKIDMTNNVLTSIKVNGTTSFLDGDGNTAEENKLIVLYYYNLTNKNGDNYLNDYNAINTIALNDFIIKNNIKITPNIGVRIKVSSSNLAVLTVLSNGSIRLNGEGVATLTFSSVINPNVFDEITIVVRSMPTDYNIYKTSTVSEATDLNGQSINIIKGSSKYIYENYTGEITINNTTYNYTMTSDVRVVVEKTNDSKNVIAININKDNKQSIDNLTPIVVSALNKSDDVVTISLTPYVKFDINGTTRLIRFVNAPRTFTINTKQGASNISMDITDAVISKGDTMPINFEIATDEAITNFDITIDVKSQYGSDIEIKDNNGNTIDGYSLIELLVDNNNKLDSAKRQLTLSKDFDAKNQIQTENFILKINQDAVVEKDLYLTITFRIQDKTAVLNLVVLPQKITSIVVNNFKEDVSQGQSSWGTSQIIRPGKPNVITIDIAPDIAYYEYLEITDTYTDEKITFIQLDKFSSSQTGLKDSKALNRIDEVSSDGYGIKLVKQTDDKRFYVYTLLSQMAEISTIHRLMITVYSSSGYVLGRSYLDLESTIFPTIVLSYLDAKDNKVAESDSRLLDTNQNVDLALGVEAKIATRTINTDGTIAWTIDVLKDDGISYQNNDITGLTRENLLKAFSIVAKGDYYYLFTDYSALTSYTNALYGSSVKITATVKKMTNAHEESASASLVFTLQKFTLNGVSMRSDISTSQNRVGGITNRESNLEFYFDRTDINFYDNGYWNKSYVVDWNNNAKTTTNDLINQMLQNLNKFDMSALKNGVTLSLVSNTGNTTIDLTSGITGLNTDNPTYLVKNNSTDLIKFTKDNDKIKFTPLSVSLNNWSFRITIKYNYNDNIPKISSEGDKQIRSTFGINISEISTLFDYKPVSTPQEFIDMVEGNYYILTDDITLTNYNLLDINLGGFDGNGHTITIKSFDYNAMATSASDKVGYFGLFKEIYSGEIIKNVHIKYELDTRDLCEYAITDDEYYSTIYFGGIAAKSSGIITNSIVEGDWNLSASKTSPSNFYLAGIVCDNAGYITNCTSKVGINAGGLVAGVATINSGKIATTRFEGSISSYSSSTLSNLIRTAGFVLDNSGEISLSCIQNDKEVSLASAGSIGGFVYNNSGTIYDCSLSNVSFNSRGEVGGFAHTSTGKIIRSYVNSTASLQGDRSKDAFVFKKSGTFQDCFYIFDSNVVSNVAGINCILRNNMLNEASYTNFIFTGDDYGVWKMTGNGPVITSAYTLIGKKSSITTQVDGQDKTTYLVAGTKDIPYLIYDYLTYQYYMDITKVDSTLYGYYRVVCDIDLSGVKDNPISSKYTFAGILEGNNMTLGSFGLYSTPNVESIGLFKEIKGSDSNGIVNNLTIKPEGIRASNSSTVGVLAGIIDSAKVYNVIIDSPNLVVMGKNAVGGLAGIIKGTYNINGITSNVTVNAIYRQSVEKKVNLYIGRYKSNSMTLSNISTVSYAGAIAGIVDGYDYRTETPIVLNNYYKIKNITINGNVVVVGEIVGSAFGLVAERSMVDNITFNVDTQSALKGVYYSGGAVGENRGIVSNAKIVSALDKYNLFDANMNGNYANVCGGVVAMNMGGLVYNSVNTANVISMEDLSTVGGIVARNVNGTIVNCKNSGAIYGYIAGGVCGTDYQRNTLANASAEGSITSGTTLAIPVEYVNYEKIKLGTTITTDKIQNVNLEDLKSWFATEKEVLSAINKPLNTVYSYTYSAGPETVTLNYSKVMGAVLAMTDQNVEIKLNDSTMSITTGEKIVLNNLKEATVSANGVYFLKDNSNGDYYFGGEKYKEKLINDYDENNSYDEYYTFDNSRKYGNMTLIINFKHKFNNNERYGDLQQTITDTNNTKQLDYFYISCVANANFDFWNANEGYSSTSYLFVL